MKRIGWDLLAFLGFGMASTLCYIGWMATNYVPWICYTTALVITIGLGFWLRWLWPRLGLWLTKFFCIAALFDLLMEGFVHPFHPETLVAKLTCQLTLFGVYAIYLAILRPLDAWRLQRRSVAV